ncbi:MAG: class I SAM-dependent methyltransferase [Deltaproteobacteria bacterium]|nr:class I SAM-dependent methyltransferase [Deltaproteobacteria bacterium]
MIKFCKSSNDVLGHKESFFAENDLKLSEFKEMFKHYSAQPKRVQCKNCCYPLGKSSFSKSGVDYFFCSNCGHFNGGNEDTDTFCAALYTEGKGEAYGKTYSAETCEAYNNRVKDIYIPKVDFVIEALQEKGKKPEELGYADLGAGSGYFVSALKNKNLLNVAGYEVSSSQVELANNMLGADLIRKHNLSDTVEIISSLKAEVVSMIGVLEHLQNPRDILKAITENDNIEYLYLSLPLFSPCVFFEIVFEENVMPRHCAPAHTHLYTETSIDYFCNEFGFDRASEWWFGSDMIDLFRSIWVMLKKNPHNNNASELWESMFKPLIDDLQKVHDERKMASEVHMLLSVKR